MEIKVKEVIGGEIINLHNASALKTAILKSLDQSKSDDRELILDIKDISYIDSTGLGIFLSIKVKAAEKNKITIIKNPSEGILRLLKVINFDKYFQIIS